MPSPRWIETDDGQRLVSARRAQATHQTTSNMGKSSVVASSVSRVSYRIILPTHPTHRHSRQRLPSTRHASLPPEESPGYTFASASVNGAQTVSRLAGPSSTSVPPLSKRLVPPYALPSSRWPRWWSCVMPPCRKSRGPRVSNPFWALVCSEESLAASRLGILARSRRPARCSKNLRPPNLSRKPAFGIQVLRMGITGSVPRKMEYA